jgi:hypothetical protein
MWWSLSVTCDRSVVFSWYSIQHYVMKFVSDLRQVCGFLQVLYTTLCDEVCQWLATGRWFSPGTLYNIMWWSLSVTCDRSVVFSWYSIQHYVMKFVSDLRQVCGFLQVLYTTLCDEVCQWLVTGRWFSPGTLYNIMWWSLSVTCDVSVVFSRRPFH